MPSDFVLSFIGCPRHQTKRCHAISDVVHPPQHCSSCCTSRPLSLTHMIVNDRSALFRPYFIYFFRRKFTYQRNIAWLAFHVMCSTSKCILISSLLYLFLSDAFYFQKPLLFVNLDILETRFLWKEPSNAMAEIGTT